MLEKNINHFENKAADENTIPVETYEANKLEFETLMDEKTSGHILRSKTDWYEKGEKSSKFFLSLEKKRGVQNTIKAVISEGVANDLPADVAGDAVNCPNEIKNEIKNFYSNLFKRNSTLSVEQCLQFLDNIELPFLTPAQNEKLRKPLSITEIEYALKNSKNGKSPGNDGLTREFYVVFWKNIGNVVFESYLEGKQKGFLSISQRQAVIKLLEKRGKDKRYIKNWRPISLINFDAKLLSKALAERLKAVLPSIIKHDQTAYVYNRFIGESVRVVSDVLEITKTMDIEGYILTMDIEKAFDSVDHPFLFATLEKIGFDPYFLDWIKVLLNKQESCVINGGVSTGYFPLERGSRQGDPISAYLFIIVMEVFFTMIRSNPNIKGLDIFGFMYLLTAYADDTTFFPKDLKSVHEIFKTFDLFSKYSGLKANVSKCEIAGIGVKNGAQLALLGLRNINLNDDSIRILGVHFSYNSLIYKEKNFQTVVETMERTLAVWRWRNLSIAGKITIFKTLVLSKIISISFLSSIPNVIIDKIEKLQKDYIWSGKNPKIKHSSLIGDYADGGLKDVDIKAKFKSLKLSWIRRLYSSEFHPWKNIPLKLIEQSFKQNIFHSNIKITPPRNFPEFYKQIIIYWSELNQQPLTAESVLMQPIWFNQFIEVNNLPIKKLFPFSLFVSDLINSHGTLLNWDEFKNKFNLENKDFFKWRQIISAIPSEWKEKIISHAPLQEPIFQHTLQLTRPLPLIKLTSKQIYLIFIHKIRKPPTSQTKINNLLSDQILKWDELYVFGRQISIDSYSRMFYFKCTHNILYLNSVLFKMKLVVSPLCSYCHREDETLVHLFFHCINTKELWNNLASAFPVIELPALTPKSAFFGFHPLKDRLVNHIHLIFRIALYTKRESGTCNLSYVKNKISQIRKIEENLAFMNSDTRNFNINKWSRLDN